jgi:hypothetical protein
MNALKNVALLAVLVSALACGQETRRTETRAAETKKAGVPAKQTFNFDDQITGSVPKGWVTAETAAAGTPATWRVEELKGDAHKNAVKVDTKNKEGTVNLLMTSGPYAGDLDFSAAIKAGTGEDDQGGGLLWRAKDADNYYLTRWNPLETNIRLYRVVKGVRTTLKSLDGLDADAKAWHTIAVSNWGPKITVKFDDKVVLEAEDTTFLYAGRLGFWTKADASSWFDDAVISWAKP